jgi:hypothetical protein
MKPLLIAIAFLFIAGCKDNVVNHYIEVPGSIKVDTVNRCDSTGHDGNDDGEHGHHKKPHLKAEGDD